jgi:acyl-CoA reductase-like NAD-dependent aldehyde dehydrogenase
MRTEIGLFLDGQQRHAHSRERITVIDPTIEAPLGAAPAGDAEDVDTAVRSAERALREGPWPAMELQERAEIARRLATLLRSHADELAELSARQMGAPVHTGRSLLAAPELIEAYVDAALELDFEYLRLGATGDALVRRRPIGVVAGIIPWNAPVRSAIKKAVPALLAGCTVVLKPAPETPFDSLRVAELLSEAGLPPGVVNVVPGGAETGRRLVAHPAIRKVAFTGSSATGASIAADCAPRFTRLQLELGGKSAAVLLDDADVAAAGAELAYSAFHNSGQACVALTRAVVPTALHDDLVDVLCTAARDERVGDPLDEATTMGPLVSARQRERVEGYIQTGRREGAQVAACGGRPPGFGRGWFVEPTVLTGVGNAMTVAREEIFGPVISVIACDDEDEAVAIANDSDYGLSGAVFSADPMRALEIARRFDTGNVAVNGARIPITAPFGGVKRSGLGREHGPEGFDHFLEYAAVTLAPGQAVALHERYPVR